MRCLHLAEFVRPKDETEKKINEKNKWNNFYQIYLLFIEIQIYSYWFVFKWNEQEIDLNFRTN